MYSILSGVKVVEASSFIASPLAGLYLAQMGAEVIRVDQIGGGPDFHRWPKSQEGASFYWEGLNKAKKSVAVNLSIPEGRELLQRIATAPGANSGLLLTNYPEKGFLSYEKLSALRSDIIVTRVMGRADGRTALDYTVNCELGIPYITGPPSLGNEPINHALPVWDLLAGSYAAFAILAAERWRGLTGKGGEARVPLADIGISTVGNLGQIAEVLYQRTNRSRCGNDIFGGFGRDFVTADDKRLMIAALTPRQWSALIHILELEEQVIAIENARGVSFANDEGVRFQHLDVLVPLVAEKVRCRNSGELTAALDRLGGCWGKFQTTVEAVDDPVLVRENPIFSEVENLSGFTYPTPGAPATLRDEPRQPARAAPRLGQHTEEVLSGFLGLSGSEIGAYIDSGVVARPND